VQAALGIYSSAADRANEALVAGILDGSVPLAALPMPAQGHMNRAGVWVRLRSLMLAEGSSTLNIFQHWDRSPRARCPCPLRTA
jgi:hypothetical protein